MHYECGLFKKYNAEFQSTGYRQIKGLSTISKDEWMLIYMLYI